MNIILLGSPGSGKGTQGENISKHYNLFKISSGDLLRKEIEQNTPLGKEIKTIIANGNLVSDNIINNLIDKHLSKKEYSNNYLFDGYPRNLKQAENLDSLLKKYTQQINCVLSLQVDSKIIVKRILGRQVCTKCSLTFNEFFNPSTADNHKCGNEFLNKRSDDNEQAIKRRFETYTKETLPILNFYKNRGLLYKIEGNGDIDQIYEKIRHIMTSLKG